MSIDVGADAPVPVRDRSSGEPAAGVARGISRSRTRRSVLVAMVVAVGLVSGACGGSGDASVGGDTTIEDRVLVWSSSVPTTTAASTTTIDGSDAARAQRGFQRYLDAWVRVMGRDRPGVALLGEVLVGRAHDEQVERARGFIEIGLYTDLPDPALLRGELMWVGDEDGRLTAEFCIVDRGRLMQMGTDRVMNDELVVSRVVVTFEDGGASSPRPAELRFSPALEGGAACG